jgi:hypothetical protein
MDFTQTQEIGMRLSLNGIYWILLSILIESFTHSLPKALSHDIRVSSAGISSQSYSFNLKAVELKNPS